MSDNPRNRLLSELMVQAEGYYPAREAPLPDLSKIHFGELELCFIFDATMSAKAHLALVDQEPIRKAVERHAPGTPVRDAVQRSWKRHQ